MLHTYALAYHVNSIAAMNATSVMCSAPVRDLRGFYARISIAFCVVAAITVAARFTSKIWLGTPVWWDDWVLLFAMVDICCLQTKCTL